MIILDNALAAREEFGRPVRVGLIGAGFMGRGVASQIIRHIPGMRLVAVANRTLATALRAYTEAGVRDFEHVQTLDALNHCIATGKPAVTDDATLLCRAEGAHSDDRDHPFRSIATTRSGRSRPPVPDDRDQCGAGVVAPLDVDGDVSLRWFGQARRRPSR